MIHILASFLALAVLSVAYLTGVRRIERLRLVVSNRNVSSMLGTFTFAAAMLLPDLLILALVGTVYAAVWPAFRRAGARPHRHAYTAASAGVACLVAAHVMRSTPFGLAVPVGIAVFMIVNLSLTLAAVVTARHWQSLPLFTNPRTHLVVFSTQVCGALVGLGMQWHSAVAVLGVPVLALVHSDALKGTLRDTGAVDDGGVCNRAVWLFLAEEAYRRGEWFAVVLVEVPSGDALGSALAVLRSHARPDVEDDGTGAPRAADLLGVYSPTQVVLLRHMTTAAASATVAGRIADDLRLLALPGAVGLSGSKQGSVPGMLAIAAAEAAVRQAVEVSDQERR